MYVDLNIILFLLTLYTISSILEGYYPSAVVLIINNQYKNNFISLFLQPNSTTTLRIPLLKLLVECGYSNGKKYVLEQLMNQEREGRTPLRNSEWRWPVESGEKRKKNEINEKKKLEKEYEK